MSEKGYLAGGKSMHDNAMAFNFFEKRKVTPEDTVIESRRVGLYKEDNAYCFAFYTTCRKEYEDGLRRLKNSDFLYVENGDTSQYVEKQDTSQYVETEDTSYSPLFFQRKNLTVHLSSDIEEGDTVYTFLLKKKQLPEAVQFAEDLLSFDSHEYLVTYFGEKNVKKDVYYFSEKKVRKCSVLFGNSNKQAVFVWDDEDNLCKLSYILISGILPTETGLPFNDNIGRNKWTFKSGIYSGMSIRDLIKLNEQDFNFYGINSEFSLMVEPVNTGNIDFKKTGIMLTSLDGESALLKKLKVSAAAAVENRIALHVFYIMLTP